MNSYKTSHASKGYGETYKKGYETGYNHYQWEHCEKQVVKDVFLKLKKKNYRTYLDFACGTGRILKVGEEIFEDNYGVDISNTMLDVARNETKNAELFERDILSNPLDKKFDVISSFRFFTNAETSLSTGVLNSLHKMLNDEGTLVINIHRNAEGLLSRLYKLRGIKDTPTSAKFLSYSDIEALLEETGFSINEIQWYSYLPKSSHYPEWFLKFGFSVFEGFSKRLLFPKKRWSQCFIVTAKKSFS